MMGAYEDEDANESHRDGDVVADDSEQNAREEKPFGYYVRYNALRASVFETHTQQLKEIEREREKEREMYARKWMVGKRQRTAEQMKQPHWNIWRGPSFRSIRGNTNTFAAKSQRSSAPREGRASGPGSGGGLESRWRRFHRYGRS
jgi:hypothetical protein